MLYSVDVNVILKGDEEAKTESVTEYVEAGDPKEAAELLCTFYMHENPGCVAPLTAITSIELLHDRVIRRGKLKGN